MQNPARLTITAAACSKHHQRQENAHSEIAGLWHHFIRGFRLTSGMAVIAGGKVFNDQHRRRLLIYRLLVR